MVQMGGRGGGTLTHCLIGCPPLVRSLFVFLPCFLPSFAPSWSQEETEGEEREIERDWFPHSLFLILCRRGERKSLDGEGGTRLYLLFFLCLLGRLFLDRPAVCLSARTLRLSVQRRERDSERERDSQAEEICVTCTPS